MKTSTSSKRSPLAFFVLVFALSLLIELLGPLAEHFSAGLPLAIPSGCHLVDGACGYVPLIVACILVSREGQLGGIRKLFSRVFDVKRIRHKVWSVPIRLWHHVGEKGDHYVARVS